MNALIVITGTLQDMLLLKWMQYNYQSIWESTQWNILKCSFLTMYWYSSNDGWYSDKQSKIKNLILKCSAKETNVTRYYQMILELHVEILWLTIFGKVMEWWTQMLDKIKSWDTDHCKEIILKLWLKTLVKYIYKCCGMFIQ